MAFVSGNSPDQSANSDQEKDKNQMGEQAPITSAPAGGGGPGKPSGQASSKGPSQPFTNLSAYLSANGPQVEQMGSDIAGKLNTEYQGTAGAIDQASSAYNQGVDSGYTPYDSSLLSSFRSSPTAVANDPTKAASFNGMYNDKYTGPGAFEDTAGYADLSDKVSKGSEFAKQVGTLPGLQSYLSSQSPTYTQGQATLDSSLLQTHPQAVTTINNAAGQFNNLPGYLTNAVTAGDQRSQAAQAAAQQAKAAAQGAYDAESNEFTSGVNDKYQAAQKQATDFNTSYNDLTRRLSGVMPTGMDNGVQPLTPEQLKGLNLDSNAINRYTQANQILNGYSGSDPTNMYLAEHGFGAPTPMPLNSFLTGGHTASMPSINSVASPDDFATAQALSQLGGDGRFTSPLDMNAADKAGTYAMDGQYQTWNKQGADSLFNEVNSRDKALGDDFVSKYSGELNGATDYSSALKKLQQDIVNAPPDGSSGSWKTLAALNRLVSGFDAPAMGYTPDPASAWHLQPTNLPPPTDGGHVFH